MSEMPPPREAEHVPAGAETWDWRPEVTLYQRGNEPRLAIYTAGTWREAVVTEKDTWPDGRTSIRCAVVLPAHITGPSFQGRHFWWAPASMRPEVRDD